MDNNRTRTFVLVSRIPSWATDRALTRSLSAQTSGVMRVLHPSPSTLSMAEEEATTNRTDASASSSGPSKNLATYALVLYESTATALAACRAAVTLTMKRRPAGSGGGAVELEDGEEATKESLLTAELTMRAIKTQQVLKLEATYQDTIEVEREVVQKTALAPTRGLQLALSATAGIAEVSARGTVPRWCNHTRSKEDCPRGTSCRFIHLAAHQRTGKPESSSSGKRPLPGGSDECGALSSGILGSSGPSCSSAAASLFPESVLSPLSVCVPSANTMAGPEFVPISLAEAGSLMPDEAHTIEGLDGDDADDALDMDAVRAALSRRVSEAVGALRSRLGNPVAPVLIRVDAEGGVPYDAPFIGLNPVNGEVANPAASPMERVAWAGRPGPRPSSINTPLDRDVYLAKALATAHALLCFGSPTHASPDREDDDAARRGLEFLERSPKVRALLLSLLCRREGEEHSAGRSHRHGEGGSAVAVAAAASRTAKRRSSDDVVLRLAVVPVVNATAQDADTEAVLAACLDVQVQNGKVLRAYQHHSALLVAAALRPHLPPHVLPAHVEAIWRTVVDVVVHGWLTAFGTGLQLRLAASGLPPTAATGGLTVVLPMLPALLRRIAAAIAEQESGARDTITSAQAATATATRVITAFLNEAGPGNAVVAVSACSLSRIGRNSLYAAATETAAEAAAVYRTKRSVFTQHLPRYLERLLTAQGEITPEGL